MNTKPLATWVQALVFRAPGYSKKSLCLIFVLFSAPQAFAWTDGELLIWISSNRTFHALSGLGRFLGTIRMCTGALGLISLKANVLPFRRPIGCAEGRFGFYGDPRSRFTANRYCQTGFGGGSVGMKALEFHCSGTFFDRSLAF
jgi:hypothetical protein